MPLPQPHPGSTAVGFIGLFFQSDTDLSGIVLGEADASFLKSFLYFEDCREISFHDSVDLFDSLQSC
jgi:hypothetical protein